MNHIAYSDHKNDGWEHDGHHIDGFPREFHDSECPEPTEQYHEQGNYDAPSAVKGQPQEKHDNGHANRNKQYHLALHDIDVVFLGNSSTRNVTRVFPGFGQI